MLIPKEANMAIMNYRGTITEANTQAIWGGGQGHK